MAQIQSALVEYQPHAPAALAIPQIQKENGKVSLMYKLDTNEAFIECRNACRDGVRSNKVCPVQKRVSL